MSEKAAKRDLVTEAAVKAKVLQVDEIKSKREHLVKIR
jgi:hypothetical protein